MTLSLLTPSRSGSGCDGRDEAVVGVHDALGFSGGAGGEHQQRHLVRVRAHRGEFGRVSALLPRCGHERFPGRVRVAGLAVDHEHVLQGRPGRPEPVHHGRVVELAELPRDHQDLGFGEPDHETDLAVPVDRDQRVADRADPGGREMQDQELDPVRQLERHDVAGLDAEFEQTQRAAVGFGLQLPVGDLPAGVDRRGLVRGAGRRVVEEIGDGAVREVARLGVLVDGLLAEDRVEGHRDVCFSSS